MVFSTIHGLLEALVTPTHLCFLLGHEAQCDTKSMRPWLGQLRNQDYEAHSPSLQPGILLNPSHDLLKLSRILPGQREFCGHKLDNGRNTKGGVEGETKA